MDLRRQRRTDGGLNELELGIARGVGPLPPSPQQ